MRSFSHDRHDGDRGGFSGFDHGLVFGLEGFNRMALRAGM
jgi:hypothetical protein